MTNIRNKVHRMRIQRRKVNVTRRERKFLQTQAPPQEAAAPKEPSDDYPNIIRGED